MAPTMKSETAKLTKNMFVAVRSLLFLVKTIIIREFPRITKNDRSEYIVTKISVSCAECLGKVATGSEVDLVGEVSFVRLHIPLEELELLKTKFFIFKG